jgi:hypothetical protein
MMRAIFLAGLLLSAIASAGAQTTLRALSRISKERKSRPVAALSDTS